MKHVCLVALGGALGAVARHALSGLTLRLWGPDFPFGILLCNLMGSFLMGFLAGFIPVISLSSSLRFFLGVGFLGAFTTFSAFSLDVMLLLEKKLWGMAGFYAGFSVVGSVTALFIGLVLARKVQVWLG